MKTILTRNHAILDAEVQAHIAADALIGGRYWEPSGNAVGGTGCFISCLTHSADPAPAFERFGLTEPLLRIAENIFETLPNAEATAFFAALPAAVACDGKDLSRVHWHFLAVELRALPAQTGDVKTAIERVILGMDLLAKGQEWPAAGAARAAALAARAATNAAGSAAYAARAATNAAGAAGAAGAADDAADAARTAAYAADAAYFERAGDADGAAYAYAHLIRRQRDTLLQLIADAPVMEVAA